MIVSDKEGFDFEFEVIPEAAKTIRMIFDWKLEGVSLRVMEKKLNASAPWTPPPRKKEDRKKRKKGNNWRTSYIRKILASRAVIGEYQPHRKVDGKRIPDGEPKIADDLMDTLYATVAEFEPELLRDKMFQAFVKVLARRRMTKEGRFVRVCFATGAVVDLVPHGSLASGVELIRCAKRRTGWRFVEPRVDRLWQDFKTAYRKATRT